MPDLSLRLEKDLRHQISRTCIETVHIGMIYLLIRTQNKADELPRRMYRSAQYVSVGGSIEHFIYRLT